ncbi:hypothetical protein M5689_002540 [Euphorbia peplus]|nr:hypothetical protein M5689_002540 [Euphorbia peplus]
MRKLYMTEPRSKLTEIIENNRTEAINFSDPFQSLDIAAYISAASGLQHAGTGPPAANKTEPLLSRRIAPAPPARSAVHEASTFNLTTFPTGATHTTGIAVCWNSVEDNPRPVTPVKPHS